MSRRIHSLTNPGVFLDYAGDWLYRDEVRNNLILGTAASASAAPPSSNLDFLIIEDSGEIEGCALLVPSGRIILTDCSLEGLRYLMSHYLRLQSPIIGVSGPHRTSRYFAQEWSRQSRSQFKQMMVQVLFRLSAHPLSDIDVPGQLRIASIDDLEAAASWLDRFGEEAGVPGLNSTEEGLRLILSGSLFFWQDRNLKCMAAVTGQTSHGARIGWVYTPPEARRKGYATACVANLSRRLLESGLEFCCLFADRANPFSMRLYEKIGYCAFDEFGEFSFVRRG